MPLNVQAFLLFRKRSSPHLCQSSTAAANSLFYKSSCSKMELHLKIIGILLILLALIHAVFPKYFNWKQELNSLSIINRQLMYVHSFFIAFVVLLIGVLCLSSANELLETTLGKRISLGLGIFWLTRFFIQFFGYSVKIWKGKTFETTVHILFSVLWAYLSIIFCFIYVD